MEFFTHKHKTNIVYLTAFYLYFRSTQDSQTAQTPHANRARGNPAAAAEERENGRLDTLHQHGGNGTSKLKDGLHEETHEYPDYQCFYLAEKSRKNASRLASFCGNI